MNVGIDKGHRVTVAPEDYICYGGDSTLPKCDSSVFCLSGGKR